jgi:hypothetical protein
MSNKIFSLNSLIELYKTLDESKVLVEDIINKIGQEHYNSLAALPPDVQKIVETTLKLTPEQRATLMRFIESLQSE